MGTLMTAAVTDQLGRGRKVTLALPLAQQVHIVPGEDLAALHEAGLDAAIGVYVDAPSSDRMQWPPEDRVFLDAIRSQASSAVVEPLVWCRVRTAEEYPVVRGAFDDFFPPPIAPPRNPEWPVDFTGVELETLVRIADERPGSEIIQHIPAGDGWHRVAWLRYQFAQGETVGLVCECSIQGVRGPEGGWTSTSGNEHCPYLKVAAYLRGRALHQTAVSPSPDTLRTLLDRALAGEWLGQQSGGDMWGSNLYLQTVSVLLDVPMPWALATEAVERGLVSIDGAVLGLPRPTLPAPVGPIMPWESQEAGDGDWIVWWTRLNGLYQVEVVRDSDSRDRGTLAVYDHSDGYAVIHTQSVDLMYGAVFGPDIEDIQTWQQTATAAVDRHQR